MNKENLLVLIIMLLVTMIPALLICYNLNKLINNYNKKSLYTGLFDIVLSMVLSLCVWSTFIRTMNTIELTYNTKEDLGKETLNITEYGSDYIIVGEQELEYRLDLDKYEIIISDVNKVERIKVKYKTTFLLKDIYIVKENYDYKIYLTEEKKTTMGDTR